MAVEKRRIVLLGATGYTGQRVLRELLGRGEGPTLVGRNPAKSVAAHQGSARPTWSPTVAACGSGSCEVMLQLFAQDAARLWQRSVELTGVGALAAAGA